MVPAVSTGVVDEDAQAPETSPTTRLATPVGSRDAGLVDECSGAPEAPGPLLGDPDPSGVGRDDSQWLAGILLRDMGTQRGQCHEVVDRAVEEALNLVGVEIDGHQPVLHQRSWNRSAISRAEIGHARGVSLSWRA